MKCNKHILYQWTDTTSKEFKIAWAEAAQHLGLDLSRWIRDLDAKLAQSYLYVDPKTKINQLVLETFNDVVDQEFIYRSTHLRLINNGCEQKK